MRIWFNRHFSHVSQLVRLLRQANAFDDLQILVSHRSAEFSGFAFSDEHFLEPPALEGDAYVTWCLDTAVQRNVRCIVPGREAAALAADAPRFAAHGILVLSAATSSVLSRIDRKDWVYANAPVSVPMPRHVSVSDDAGLAAAISSVGMMTDVCIKPCVGVYGEGFHRLVANEHRRDGDALTVDEWHAKYGPIVAGREQLVMEYLPGTEFSVDLACREGEMLAGVVRRKPATGSWRYLDERPDLLEHAATLCATFDLNGLVNVQFREDRGGTPRLLEINPRAAGGIGMSSLSGINLPGIAYAVLLGGRVPELPLPPRLGICVTEIPMAVALPGLAR